MYIMPKFVDYIVTINIYYILYVPHNMHTCIVDSNDFIFFCLAYYIIACILNINQLNIIHNNISLTLSFSDTSNFIVFFIS